MKYNILIFLYTVLFISCRKEKSIELKKTSIEEPVYTVVGQVLHHVRPVDTASVYLKKDSPEFPGTNVLLYDVSTPVFSDQAYYIFKELKAGQYFIYAAGYDRSISDSVFGGIPLKVGGPDSILTFNVPVTE